MLLVLARQRLLARPATCAGHISRGLRESTSSTRYGKAPAALGSSACHKLQWKCCSCCWCAGRPFASHHSAVSHGHRGCTELAPPTSSLQHLAGNGHGGVHGVGDDLNDRLQSVTPAADTAAAGVGVTRLAAVTASEGGVRSWLSQGQTPDPPPGQQSLLPGAPRGSALLLL